MRTKTTILAAIALMLATAFALLSTSKSASAATCVPATNIEAIVDDSGSMAASDFARNRVAGLEILISKAGNQKKQLGAIEFGSGFGSMPAATQVFAPSLIGSSAAAMRAALRDKIKGDAGATDYNGAFALAQTENPSADARIFLTDGGHNAGDYLNGHAGGPKTYVVGLGFTTATPGDPDSTRLQQIASETGGAYFPNVTTDNVAATMNRVDAALGCQQISRTFTDKFRKKGQKRRKSLRVGRRAKSLELVLTWSSPLNRFDLKSVALKSRRGKKRRLKIRRIRGETFLTVRISNLRQGTLRFQLVARKLGQAGTGVNLTTQASQG